MKVYAISLPLILAGVAAILVVPTLAEKPPVESLKTPAVKVPADSTAAQPKTPQKNPVTFPIAQPHINEYGVEWHPLGNEELSLSVTAPDGTVSSEVFHSDSLPHYDFHDEYGNPRPEGTYTYELKVIPGISPETHSKMKSVQDSPIRDVIVGDMKITGELPAEAVVQTGAFTFRNHQVVMGDAVNMDPTHSGDSDEPRVQKDQVIPDDLIVQNSLCVGIDCVNNESFGFDTIRIKENNTRIKFEDTSVGTFPTTDWQLTANDSASGGASRFSIEDITMSRNPFTIRSGARTNSLYVDAEGRIGLGTSSPALRLHLADGNTPAIRFDQDGSGGWGTHVWDLAGNEANFFLRDVSAGGRLVLRVRPGAPSNSLYIENNGNVGLGNATPKNRLDVEGGAAVGAGYAGSVAGPANGLIVEGNAGIGTSDIEPWAAGWGAMELGGNSSMMFHTIDGSLHSTNNAYYDGVWKYKKDGRAINHYMNSGDHIWRVSNAAGSADAPVTWNEAVRIAHNGRVGIANSAPTHLLQVGNGGAVCNGTTWIDGSSRDYKKEIKDLSKEDLESLMTILDEVNLVSYLYKQDNEATPKRIGMIAEEMPDILSSEDRKGMELGRHVGFLMGVVKALHIQNEEMESELEQLREEIRAIREGN